MNNNIKMESDNDLKEINIKNCAFYYYNDKILILIILIFY